MSGSTRWSLIIGIVLIAIAAAGIGGFILGKQSTDVATIERDAYLEGRSYGVNVGKEATSMHLSDLGEGAARYAQILLDLELAYDRAWTVFEGHWAEPEKVLASEIADMRKLISELRQIDLTKSSRLLRHRHAHLEGWPECVRILQSALRAYKRADRERAVVLSDPLIDCVNDLRERSAGIAYQ